MFIKGIDNDALQWPPAKRPINIDQSAHDRNTKLKIDCYNNLAGK